MGYEISFIAIKRYSSSQSIPVWRIVAFRYWMNWIIKLMITYDVQFITAIKVAMCSIFRQQHMLTFCGYTLVSMFFLFLYSFSSVLNVKHFSVFHLFKLILY